MQETAAGLEHMPAPLHVLAGMTEAPSAEQCAAGHAMGVGVEQTPAPLHVLAGMLESPSDEQVAAPQRTGVGDEQMPAPPQVLAGIRDRLSAEQLAAGHGTAAGSVHMPAPSQVPAPTLEVVPEHIKLPHVSPAWVWQAVPFAAQSALLPQAWSVAQALAQQTFAAPAPALVLTQFPLAQSLAAVQEAPFALGSMHSPPMHA